jgi:2-polyprenyl-6-methoxyphenol hydroxylase-like FAD-dependent oxidoreductase
VASRVLIVGAGPAGAALSWLLARNGVEVTLVERERHFERVFRGEALMPCGLDALHQMGLRAELEALPWRHLESWDIHLDGRLIMHIPEPSAELGDLALRVVAQPRLLELLVRQAGDCAGFELKAPLSVRGLLEQEGRVRGVRAATPEGEIEIEADLVIGADGRASMVRQRAELALDLLPESYDVLWFKLPVPEELRDRRPILIFASGPDALLAYVSWDERLQIAWMVEKGSWRELRQRDWMSELTRLLSTSLADHVRSHRDEIEGPVLLDVIVGRCPRWSRPGLLLVGDAAHPMSPIRAQGINMALRDAIVAANHLVPVLRDGGALETALAAIQQEREREIVRAQTLQLREARGQRWARERPWLIWPLLKLAPLLARTQWVQKSWLRQQRELRFGVTKVLLSV